MQYLQNTLVKTRLDKGTVYQKKAETLLRKPKPEELGQEFATYVKEGDSVRKESLNIINDSCIVARNKELLATIKDKAVYNEWLIPLETAIKNYGQAVIDGLNSNEFTSHKKQATLTAIELTPEVMTELGQTGDTLEITVSWSTEPMIAKVGDYLSNGGYSISQHDMKDYQAI